MASDDFKKALRKLAGVFALTAFVLCVLSLIGLQVFMGTLRQKCIKLPTQGNQSSLSYSYSDNNNETILFDYIRHVQDPGMTTTTTTMMMMMKCNVLLFRINTSSHPGDVSPPSGLEGNVLCEVKNVSVRLPSV